MAIKGALIDSSNDWIAISVETSEGTPAVGSTCLDVRRPWNVVYMGSLAELIKGVIVDKFTRSSLAVH